MEPFEPGVGLRQGEDLFETVVIPHKIVEYFLNELISQDLVADDVEYFVVHYPIIMQEASDLIYNTFITLFLLFSQVLRAPNQLVLWYFVHPRDYLDDILQFHTSAHCQSQHPSCRRTDHTL